MCREDPSPPFETTYIYKRREFNIYMMMVVCVVSRGGGKVFFYSCTACLRRDGDRGGDVDDVADDGDVEVYSSASLVAACGSDSSGSCTSLVQRVRLSRSNCMMRVLSL